MRLLFTHGLPPVARRNGETKMVKFNKHHVAAGAVKARVHYSVDNRCDGRKCVTIYAKDYSDALAAVFGACYINDTDSQTDYFDKGRVVLFETHPDYAAARAAVERFQHDALMARGRKVLAQGRAALDRAAA